MIDYSQICNKSFLWNLSMSKSIIWLIVPALINVDIDVAVREN